MAPIAWRPGSRRWQIAQPFAGAVDLARRVNTVPLVAQILHNRGIDDPQAAKTFLNPKLTDLHDPTALSGTQQAAKLIAKAVADAKRIVIYGDYDVDGITAVAILLKCIRQAGGNVHYYVPHRIEEGYGVNAEAVRKIIADGTKLMITADCGISAAGPISDALAAGVDVIVTDHHSLPERLPAASVIVHPAMPGGEYPNKELAGAGVALKLAWQIACEVCGGSRVAEAWSDLLLDATCMAALGTIADVVPLLDENRALAMHGLRGLPATRHPGLRALLKSSGLAGEKLDAYHVGFVLAPRLNACGRMGHARLAVELLTEATAEQAAKIADFLEKQNAERQKVERAITDQAVEMVERNHLADAGHRAIVLASENWHSGVIGIVASRLVSSFNRPAILIAINRQGAQGSGRSIPGFHMRDALAACAEHLLTFGGHAMAGGIRIEPHKIPDFTRAMLDYAAGRISEDQLVPTLRIDAESTLSELNFPVANQLAKLAPFGQGNPRPVVALRRCQVVLAPRRIGRTGQTVSMVLGQNGTTVRAVGFGMGDLAEAIEGVGTVDVAAEPGVSTFGGMINVELKLRDVRW
jgi:single-stranded-DNA-specific exonuclease